MVSFGHNLPIPLLLFDILDDACRLKFPTLLSIKRAHNWPIIEHKSGENSSSKIWVRGAHLNRNNGGIKVIGLTNNLLLDHLKGKVNLTCLLWYSVPITGEYKVIPARVRAYIYTADVWQRPKVKSRDQTIHCKTNDFNGTQLVAPDRSLYF